MSKKRQISVRGDTYARLKGAAQLAGQPISQTLDALITRALDAAQRDVDSIARKRRA
jgi:hypothetical protein